MIIGEYRVAGIIATRIRNRCCAAQADTFVSRFSVGIAIPPMVAKPATGIDKSNIRIVRAEAAQPCVKNIQRRRNIDKLGRCGSAVKITWNIRIVKNTRHHKTDARM